MLADDEILEAAAARVELHHLADLLLEGHAGQQVGDALVGGQGRILVGQGRVSAGDVAHIVSLSSMKSNGQPLITNW